MSNIILASASPRRKQLLSELLEGFSVQAADIDESVLPNENAKDYVLRVAIEKAKAIVAQHPDQWVLASDTTVVLGDQILGKPEHKDHAVSMLKQLSGSEHQVLTSVVISKADTLYSCVVETSVSFDTLSDEQIEFYCDTGEPMDKAGAYGIQGFAARYVKALNGSYTGVIGLPLAETAALLRKAGITVVGDK